MINKPYVAYVMVLSKYMECLFNPLSMLIQNEMTGWFCINPFTLRDTLESIVCYSHTFENNLGINQKLTKYLKESCCLVSNQHFSFKLFPENASEGKTFPKTVRPVLAV